MPLTIVSKYNFIDSTKALVILVIKLTTPSHRVPQPLIFMHKNTMTAIRATMPATISGMPLIIIKVFIIPCTTIHPFITSTIAAIAATKAPNKTLCCSKKLITDPATLIAFSTTGNKLDCISTHNFPIFSCKSPTLFAACFMAPSGVPASASLTPPTYCSTIPDSIATRSSSVPNFNTFSCASSKR